MAHQHGWAGALSRDITGIAAASPRPLPLSGKHWPKGTLVPVTWLSGGEFGIEFLKKWQLLFMIMATRIESLP
jgi:hypothetical protein